MTARPSDADLAQTLVTLVDQWRRQAGEAPSQGHDAGCLPDPKHPGWWVCSVAGHVQKVRSEAAERDALRGLVTETGQEVAALIEQRDVARAAVEAVLAVLDKADANPGPDGERKAHTVIVRQAIAAAGYPTETKEDDRG